jgi:hypothetical protein
MPTYRVEESNMCPKWGRMDGKQVSELVLANIRQYYSRYFGNEKIFAILAATEVHESDANFDCFEIKLMYCNSIERRFLRIKELYRI